MSPPVRVQLSRRKGWRMPENTVKVSRPTKWGNPFTAEQALDAGFRDGPGMAVWGFRQWLKRDRDFENHHPAKRDAILQCIDDLRGKNLACWCALNEPCHADVLLELANPKEPT
jgi:hypothetical protein